jgi:hypothetical protein
MPQIQLGVYLADGKEAFQSVQWALEVSAHFLSAAMSLTRSSLGWISRVRGGR